MIFEQDGDALGLLSLRMEEQLHHCEKIAEVMEFAVAAPHRSQGAGQALFESACKIAAQCGCAQIEVCCARPRAGAHRFYEREGMKRSHFKFTMPLTDMPQGTPG